MSVNPRILHPMPTGNWIDEQMWLDYSVKQALLAKGDDETQPHEVDHGFLAADEASLIEIARIGALLLFEPSPVAREPTEDGTVRFSLTLVSAHCTTALYALARESLLLRALAEAHGVTYGGWGTRVVTAPAS